MWRACAESGLYPAGVPVQDFTEEQKRDLYEAETKVKVGGVNMSYMGLVTRLKTNVLSVPTEAHACLCRARGGFVDCLECHGTRLAQHARDPYINGVCIADVYNMELADAVAWLRTLNSPLAVAPLRGLEAALDLGLGCLTLGQPLSTLSGGERQRLKLAVRLCERKATADIIVLDEPTVGLHQQDIDTLLPLFDTLVDAPLTLICVEHHRAVLAHADRIIVLGPGAGSAGGEIVVACSPHEFLNEDTLTARYLMQAL